MDFSFFDPIVSVFNFIGSVLSTIIEAITGITSITASILNLVVSIMRILPNPLYPCLLAFLGLFSVILGFKIIRKG